MKIIIGIIITLLGWIWIAHATLPDTIKDPATREVIEYLDSKLQRVTNSIEKIHDGGKYGKALCLTESKVIGYCSDQPNATGDCTCVAP
jgi:hypothetical protein